MQCIQTVSIYIYNAVGIFLIMIMVDANAFQCLGILLVQGQNGVRCTCFLEYQDVGFSILL